MVIPTHAMKRFAYPTLIGGVALALVPVTSVVWFLLAGSRAIAVTDMPDPPWQIGLVTLLWPGILLARVGMGSAWLVGALCLLGLAAVLVWVTVRFARRKRGWLVVPGLAVLAAAIYSAIGTVARLAPVPLAVTTRYDANPADRATFDRYWRTGYRRAEVGFSHTYCFQPELETRAFESGQTAGIRAHQRLFGRDDSLGKTPLMWAAADGDEAAAERTIAEGADVNARDRHGRTPLMFAINWGPASTSMVELLLRRGADVNAADWHGWTPVMMASGGCPEGPLELLIQAGADVNARTESGHTALGSAAMRGTPATAEQLIGAGAEINAEDERGRTPLLVAAAWANTAVLKVLLDHGADIEHRAQSGSTAVDEAMNSSEYAKDETIRVLVAYGASTADGDR